MESYRHETRDKFSAVLCQNIKTGKMDIVHNFSQNQELIRSFWKGVRNWEIVEILPIPQEQVKVIQFFTYHLQFPRKANKKKFDFFKHVLKVDVDEKYRENFADR